MTEDSDVELLLDEACYHLRKTGLGISEISSRMKEQPTKVKARIRRYKLRLSRGEFRESSVDRSFWANVENEYQGDFKVTFPKEDGFYHCMKSDLEKMDEASLIQIFDSCKDYLEVDPSYHLGFLEEKAPVGYDPLILQREVRKSLTIVENILKQRESK